MNKVHDEGSAQPSGKDGLAAHMEIAKLTTAYWHAMATVVKPDEIKDRLKNQWGTLALVSALLVTVTLPYIISPVVETSEDDDSSLVDAFTILVSMSGVLSTCIVFFCAYMLAEIDLCTSNEDIMEFITSFDLMQQVIWGVFHLSVSSLVAAVLVIVHYHYNDHVKWIITAFSILCVLFVAYGCQTVDYFVKSKLVRLIKEKGQSKETQSSGEAATLQETSGPKSNAQLEEM